MQSISNSTSKTEPISDLDLPHAVIRFKRRVEPEIINTVPKRLNYGQSMAAMVLTAQRMGRDPLCVEYAEKLMKGLDVHPMHCAAVEREALHFHEEVRIDEAVIRQANEQVLSVMSDYGFA